LILNAAAASIEESSLLDFKMSDVSRRASMSMGSVYKHVQTKEDVLVALAAKNLEWANQVFRDTLNLPLSTPQRLVAVHMLNPAALYLYPFGVHLNMLVPNEAILARASEKWINKLVLCGKIATEIFSNVVTNALETGELMVDEADRAHVAEEIRIGHWSMDVGFLQVNYQRYASTQNSVRHELPFPMSPNDPFIKASIRFINAYPWQNKLEEQDVAEVCRLLEQKGHL